MSVLNRLEDANILLASERFDGALLNVLIAIAATSRKRYPLPMIDKDAFESFLGEEMIVVTHGMVKNYSVKFQGKTIPLQHFLYKFVRCELAHEAKIPDNIRFEENATGVSMAVEPDLITMSKNWINGLANCVKYAPENNAEFHLNIPDDVLQWFMFGKHRGSATIQEYWNNRIKRTEAYNSLET